VKPVLGLALLLSLLAVSPGQASQAPAAVVYALQGKASCAHANAPRLALRLLDRLPAGAVLTVGPGSRLAIAFTSGRRWILGAGARVTLGAADLAGRTGDVRALPPVPPLRLAPIARENRPGPRAGAVRIRGLAIGDLYPRQCAAVPAEETVLLFAPVPGATRYRIAVRDRQGRSVFAAEAPAPPVAVPAGTLLPGRRYSWSVTTVDLPGGIARGEGEILTLGEEDARARREARAVLAAEGADALPLLAEIDRGRGLFREARQELREALAARPGDPALQEALAGIESYFQSP
jgi:hypothetical protein